MKETNSEFFFFLFAAPIRESDKRKERIYHSAYHCKHRARAQKITKPIEEWPFFEIMVVLLSKFLCRNYQLNGHELVSFALKT